MSAPNQDNKEYSNNAPISIPKQCAYTLNTNLYWVGVFIIMLFSLSASGMFVFIMNPKPFYFTGYHPSINKHR